ncbi:MAG TPA: pitrilysin family protein [Candidatus Limnocylindria bacterium]|nr:pitrilysin family protein [Candidatus Limnocylindria bacterium]
MPHIPIERHRLENGLRVILSRDTRAPIVAVNLWYDVGSKHEEPGRTGFAHLFEHMMFQGSEHVAKGEHFALVQAAGGTLNATTWLDRTNYFETLPSHELELALWLEADRMASLLPAMTQEKLDNQRDVVKNERRWSVDNQPYGSWDEKIQELLYPESHPYHHPTIGSMEDLSAASLDDVQRFFATWYAPNNAVLTVAGDFEPSAALAAIERQFGAIPANPDLPPPPEMTVEPRIGREVREVVEDRVPLPRVYAAYRIATFGTDDWYALDVTADLLGSGRASRLYRALVREKRLAQDVSVFTFPLVGGASIFCLWATALPDVDHELLERELFAEMDRLREDGPSEEELARVRNLQAASTESSLERLAERADRLSMYTCLFDEPERINTEASRYAAVDADAVRRVMDETVRTDNRVVLTYLPLPGAEEAAPEAEAAEIAETVIAESGPISETES